LLHSTVITSTDKNAGYHKQITHLLMQSAILVKTQKLYLILFRRRNDSHSDKQTSQTFLRQDNKCSFMTQEWNKTTTVPWSSH